MTKYAILSCDRNPTYSVFAPITALLWREIGYEPICLVYEPNAWSHPAEKHILACLGCQTFPIAPVPGFSDSTATQCSRIFASALPLEPDCYLLTADADMFPFSREWFHQQNPQYDFHILGADAYYPAQPRFPLCYLGGSRDAWRSVMDIGDCGFASEMRRGLQGRPDDWNCDELLFSENMLRWPFFADHCQLIPRGWAAHGLKAHGRLDRLDWVYDGSSSLIDCHSLRPLYQHWSEVSQLLRNYLPQCRFHYIEAYMQHYGALMSRQDGLLNRFV